MKTSTDQSPWKILIVDDDPDIHEVSELTLKRLVFEGRGLQFIHAASAREARTLLERHPDIAVALIDVVMEDDSAGLELVNTIRNEFSNHSIRLILRTGNPGMAPEESVTLGYDINDYRCKSELSAQGLRTMVITALRAYGAFMTIHNLNAELDATQKEIIFALSEIAESRSTETSLHVQRVGTIAGILARKLGFAEADIPRIELAASMHDIGKIAINDAILNKAGPLDPLEFDTMKKHCAYGHEILCHSSRPILQSAARIAREHHENFDGSGYPQGLKSDQIDLASRIVALADVYDALGNARIYKDAWEESRVLDYLRSERGKKFDPAVVDAFFDEYPAIKERLALLGKQA